MSSDSETDFPLREARQLAKGLYRPNPAIYWGDFLLSVSLGWIAFALAVIAEPLSLGQLAALAVASLALYRSVVFTHEISHFPPGAFPLFRLVWNLLCGVPLLAPSFLYRGVHMEHHRTKIYGTRSDGEYLPFAVAHQGKILLFPLAMVIVPALVVLRFLVLTPLAWISPAIRRFVWQRASSLSIDTGYCRPLAAMTRAGGWRWQETGAFAYTVAVLVLVAAGVMPLAFVAVWYTVMVLILAVNAVRTLAAHRYRNPGGLSMSVAEQFLDSVDVPGNPWITPLWAPVGLRYHATHHLFPGLPYHNLGRAYRILKAELGDNRFFLRATRAGLRDALAQLWREAGSRQ